ncbi:hypothetical protein E2C01_091123 [Portunus trituberculatus]|uniref:Uncharacterized protein n=1 Tax=Portunus trituberculatus TaxID=210409 RepID=A0A5B7JU79_PORTR|nr:hypothetical protein [Portunus trituberculatus]
MGKRGCRVHLLAANTEYSYTRIKPNVYLYPLELNVSPGLNKYSLDGFLDLLTHMPLVRLIVTTSNLGNREIKAKIGQDRIG